MLKKKISIFIMCLLVVGGLWLPRETKAINVWGDWFDRTVGQKGFNDVGFGRTDPRTIAANLVNIMLGLLGVLAIILIMYAGFVWMTASGDPDKVNIAKKILASASIGLLIVLSSWALAIYILSRLWLATGAQGTLGEGTSCAPDGITSPCGCGGERACSGGVWSSCQGSDCGGAGEAKVLCDANTMTPECDADSTACDAGSYCNPKDCYCTKKGGYGDICDKDASNATCDVDNSLCQEFLTCSPDKCTCLGEPVIESISPMGGFCDGSVDTPCLSDADCSAFGTKICNLTAPNGAPGNLVSISGRYFLPYQAGTSKVLFWDGSAFTIEAQLAATVNPVCSESWSDSQIVVVVPAGAKSGAIQITAGNGSDSSNNNRGPMVPDFVVNNLKRPGLCNLNPIFGRLDTLLTYSGVGLSGAEAFFGSAYQNIRASNPKFTSNDTGTAQSPNVRAGKTTTFVTVAKGPLSNFLQFTQEAEASKEPIIIGFEPETGAAGQYVTIRGSGFGNLRGDSKVYFGDLEANYDFPRVCSQSVWRDEEIVVKVPKDLKDGDHKISLEVGKFKVEAAKNFKADKKAVLAPGLCKIEPLFGQANDEISFWGEYFNDKDSNSQISFFQNILRKTSAKICVGGNKDGQACALDTDCDSGKCKEEILYWGKDLSVSDRAKPDLATTKVPVGTLSGPVKIIKDKTGLASNGINFNIGQCTQDQQCGGTNVCCPNNTPAAGRCQSSMAECYGSTDACVYEWEFNTGSKNNCPKEKPNSCQDGSCCRSECVLDSASGLTTCLDNASCAGYNGSLCFDSLLCPNSPGNCSFNKNSVTTGTSCDCNLLDCPNCQFNAELNACVSQTECDLKTKVKIKGRDFEKYCANFNGANRWHISTNQTCPDGFTPTYSGSKVCVDLASTCSMCGSGLTCSSIDGFGKCVSSLPVCPNNFSCTDGVCARKEGSCECCCDKTQNKPDKTNPACCAPLSCENECGAGGNFGYCSGCANIGTTQEEHDAACNCDGHSGKFCDTSIEGGACRDCSQIGDPKACGIHEACCVNAKQGNACVGVTESKFEESNILYCAYFGCGDNCGTASTTAAYDSQTDCQGECPLSCDGDTTQGGCQKNANMCPKDKPLCNDACLCVADNINAEKSCSTDAGACSLLCDKPYGCRGEQGCQGSDCAGEPDEDSCLCCCNPLNKGTDPNASDFDKCKALGTTKKLFCQENMGSCTGDARGLCCGCSADEECGDAETVGCGADTCCHNRSGVESVIPEQASQDVCRNALIRIKFNNKMDKASFLGNVLVVGDYGDSLCPDGSTLLAGLNNQVKPNGFFAKIWQQLKDLLSKVLPSLAGNEARAAGTSNFCAFTGKTVGGSFYSEKNEEKNYADFLLEAPLDANIKYFVIVLGDDGMNNHSGVLDVNKIGIREANQTDTESFNGITYPNAYIWSFTTGEKICLIDRVVVDPNQYLFQKPRDTHNFTADAVAENNTLIVPLAIYDWAWSWRSDNSAIAAVQGGIKPDDYKATVTSGAKRDAETFVYARATITADEVNPMSTAGKYKEGRARIIVFVCENPWPAVTDLTKWPIRWEDKANNCTVNKTAECLNNNFAVYYCRDKASKGTKDDLPSLTAEPPIRGKYKYQSSGLWVDVLKDFYFFRIALPNAPDKPTVVMSDIKAGGEVEVSWNKVKDTTYGVYYGTKSGDYDDYVYASSTNSIKIGGLKNGQDYYFAITATNLQKAESTYSEEVKFRVEDKVAPSDPSGVEVKVQKTSNDRKIVAKWNKDTTEVVNYIIEYGPTQSSAVKIKAGNVFAYTINKLNNLSVQDYMIKITAADIAGNQSQPVKFICPKGCETECACSAD